MESASFELPDGLGMTINQAAAGTVPHIRAFEDGEKTIYLKITAFDEKGWLDSTFATGVNIGFYNYVYPQRTEYQRSFHVNRQGLVEIQTQ